MTNSTGHFVGVLREGNLWGTSPHSANTSCSCWQDSPAWSYSIGRTGWVWPSEISRVVSTRLSALTRVDMARICLDSPPLKNVCKVRSLRASKHAVPSFKHNGGSGLDSHHLPRVSRVSAGVLWSLTTTVKGFYLFFGKGARTLLSVNAEGHGFLASARERLAKSEVPEVAKTGEKTKKSLIKAKKLEDIVAIGRSLFWRAWRRA